MIFLPPAASYQRSSSLIMIPVENGQQIAAYYLPPENGDFVVLFSHGNAEDIGQNLGFFQEYQMQEVGILGYDYRGYGLSDGKASEQNTYRDIAAAYNYLIDQQQIAPERIIVHGRSVGSGPSVWLAANYPVGALVLESPFVSAFRVRTRWPIIPFDKYNNLGRIKNIKNDRIVGFWHGEKLYEAAAEPKMNYWVPNAGHNNLIYTAGDEYWDKLNEFIDLIQQYQSEKNVSDAN
ncbi:MAG: alpha/beta hydrolase [Planctomycetota bacterium]